MRAGDDGFQAGAVGLLAGKINEMIRVGVRFVLMGAGMALLATAQRRFLIFALVALLSLGMAFIAPNLSALVSKRGEEQHAGASLGAQNAANSLGQESRSGKRTAVRRSAVHLANQRAVFVERSSLAGARVCYRVESVGPAARGQTRFMSRGEGCCGSVQRSSGARSA